MSSTPKTASGQYVSVQAGTPRLAVLPDLAAGSHEVDPPSVPPVSGQPASLQTLASEAEQIALKIGWQMPEGHPWPVYP
jgi:hypothetical protein